MSEPAAAIILAGGQNSRMKKNKAFLPIGEEPFIQRIIRELYPLVSKIIIATNDFDQYADLGVELVADRLPGRGPLSGIHAGLHQSSCRLNLVVACDMPFVSRNLAAILLSQAEGFDAVVPIFHGRPQPLFAVYAKSCIQPIEDCLVAEIHKCTAFYPKVGVLYLPEAEILENADLEKIFFNVNTPEEYIEAMKRLKL